MTVVVLLCFVAAAAFATATQEEATEEAGVAEITDRKSVV